MRLTLLLILLITQMSLTAQRDHFAFFGGLYVSMLPMEVSGVKELSGTSYGGTSTASVPQMPVYGREELKALAIRVGVHLNLRVPVVNKETFSIGAMIGAGLTPQKSLKNSEGLDGIAFDFPQYLYFRSTKGNMPHSLLIGYRISIGGLTLKNPILAWEFGDSEGVGFRLSATLLSQKYYMNDQHGTLTPIFKASEYGAAFLFYF